MTKAEIQVLEFTKCALNDEYVADENLKDLSDSEIEDIIKEAKAQAVVSLVMPEVFKYNPSFKVKYENELLSIMTHNIQITNEHIRIANALENAHIDYVVIKGCASAEYYPDSLYRQMGDIDVLVRPDDFEKAGEVLKSIGFKNRLRTFEHHNTFVCNNKVCELHHIIGYVSEDGNDLSKLTEDILSTKRKIKTFGGEIYVPSAYYHGLIMLLHIYKHMFVGVGLRHISDWAAFIKTDEVQKIYDDLSDMSKKYSLNGLFNTLTNVSKLYLGVLNSSDLSKTSIALADEFIETVMNGGNFGNKYGNQVWTVFINRSYKHRQSPFKRFHDAIKINVHCRLPKTKDNKFLFFLGFITTPFYYGFMYITGKKKPPKIGKHKKMAQEKNELFAKLSDTK